jgi:hypothetical protein
MKTLAFVMIAMTIGFTSGSCAQSKPLRSFDVLRMGTFFLV